MRAIIQRVSEASVKTEKKLATIGKGFLVFVAAEKDDTPKDAEYLAGKIANLRIMADTEGKMNLPPKDVGGAILVVSQFTLFARTRKGNRPSFIDAAEPKTARKLYIQFIDLLKQEGLRVETGSFGEYMLVSLINDGPVTIIIDSQDQKKPRNG